MNSAGRRGEQQGRVCRELFRQWAGGSRTTPAGAGEAPAARHDFLDRLRRNLEAVCPEFLEECEGLAQGMEVDRARYLLTLFDENMPPPRSTTVGLRDDRGRPVLGKTDDIFGYGLASAVFMHTSGVAERRDT